MYISDFQLVDILRGKMGEDEARSLVEFIEVKVEEKYTEARNIFATKEDLIKLEGKIKEDLLKLEMKLVDTNHKNSIETQKLIADSKFETLKWLYGLIIASTIPIIGTILAVMKMGGW